MTVLAQYLDEAGLSREEFGRRIGVTKLSVGRYLRPFSAARGLAGARRLPAPDVMVRIYVETAGHVQPNDFYDLPELAPRKRRRAA